MRISFGSVLLLCGFLASCGSSDNPQTPPEQHISDLGQLITELIFDDGTVPVYSYHDVSVKGDILVADYDAALALVTPQLRATESITEVINYNAYPPSYPRIGLGGASMRITSCTEVDTISCVAGRWWTAGETTSEWTIVESGNWFGK